MGLKTSIKAVHSPFDPCILSYRDCISSSKISISLAIFFRAKGLALSMAVHRSFHQLMNLVVLGVMSPFCLSLFRYAMRALNPRASSCPPGGFGKTGSDERAG